MPIYETFAKRQRNAEREGEPALFQTSELPRPFRVQVGYILDDAIGHPEHTPYVSVANNRRSVWNSIHNTMKRELGGQNLTNERGDTRSLAGNPG